MAQEIERARVLLRALAADQAISKDVGTQVYQTWVAKSQSGETPFSRYLIQSGKVSAEKVKLTMRRLAVEGLPNPDLHTRERFEDLILCQLGVESGLISPKLVKTVRAVQEKKLKQGKLRRVRDLLPRAGFDPKTLGLLEQHMRERVLICPECLTRYPPAEDAYYSTVSCPRCGSEVTPEGFDLEASAELQKMPEHLRVILNESAERVFEPMSAQQRERPRRRQSSNNTPHVLLAVAVVTLIVVGTFALTLRNRMVRPTVDATPVSGTTSPDTPDTPDTPDAPDGDGPKVLAEEELQRLYAEERRLTEVGDYEGALRVWTSPALPSGPAGAEVREEVQGRITELKRVGKLAETARALLERLESSPDDGAAQGELARLAPPVDTPPFDAVREQLVRIRAAHRRALSEAGRRRYDELEVVEDAAGEGQAWAALAKRLESGPVELTLDLDGERKRAQVTQVTPSEATLVLGGEQRRMPWSDSWPAALEIVQRLARSTDVERQLVLRFALLARNANEAREAAQALGGKLEVGALLDGARLGAAPEVSAAGLRLTYDFSGRHWPSEFERSKGTTLGLHAQGASLRGDAPQATSPEFPVQAPGRIAFGCEVQRPPEVELRARVTLRGEAEQNYELRWSAAGWSLFYAEGSGFPKQVEKGPQVAVARKVELAIVPSGRRFEIVISLAGAEVYRRPLYKAFTSAQFTCSGAEEFRLDQVWVVGSLDPDWVKPREQAFRQQVKRALARSNATSDPAPEASGEWPELSVEDVQGLAQLSDDERERLERAKRALRAGEPDTAANLLLGLKAPIARFYWAYASCLGGDPAAAVGGLQRILAEDAEFAGARALLAYALARANRPDLATAEASEALRQRMDLAWAHLADARTRWQSAPQDDPLDPGAILSAFEVPAALGAGDPLVEEEGAAIRRLLEVEQALDQRVTEQDFTVSFASPTSLAAARELATFLEGLDSTFAKLLPDDGFGHQRVWLLDADADLGLLDGRRAAYLPRFDALVFRGSPTASTEVAGAAAEAYVARNLPLAPAWLRVGLREELTTQVPGLERDARQLVARARRERWSPERWRALFAQPRWEFTGDASAVAHAWALVRASKRVDALKVALAQERERIHSGDASSSTVARLNFEVLATEIQANLE